MAIVFDLAKKVFAWYALNLPTYEMLYGTLAIIPLFIFMNHEEEWMNKTDEESNPITINRFAPDLIKMIQIVPHSIRMIFQPTLG